MGVVQQFNALFWSWSEMLRALRRRVALGPFWVYAGAQVAALLMLLGFTVRPFSLFVPSLLKWSFGTEALHYPNNLIAMRAAMGQLDIVLSVVLGALVTASAVHIFSAFYGGERESFVAGWREGAARYAPALAVAIVVSLIAQLVVRVPMTVWGGLADTSPLKYRLLRVVLIGAVLVVQALFVYAIPAVVIDTKRVGSALGSSMAIALRSPITTGLIIGVPAALELLPAWIMRNSAVIVYRFSPEFLTFGMFLWIAVIFLMNYATIGAATRFYLHATQMDEPVNGREEEER